MKHRLFVFIALFCMVVASYGAKIDSLFNVLDETIERSTEYEQIREGRIKGLKSIVDDAHELSNEQKYLIYSKLYNEYKSYQFDSAVHYLTAKLELAKQLDDKEWIQKSTIEKIRLLASTGLYKEAYDEVETLKEVPIVESVKPDYFSTLAHFYSQVEFYTKIPNKVPVYRELKHSYRDSAILFYQSGTVEFIEELELQQYTKRSLDQSRALAFDLLHKTSPDNPDYALYAYRVACNFRDIDNTEKEKEYLLKSAIADIRNGIKDNASLTMIAKILYREKKISKAYDYIHFSLSDAETFNAPLRFIELSSILPLVNDAYNLRLEKQKDQLQRYILLISFLIVFLLASLFFIYKQFKNLSNVRTDIQKANQKLNELNEELSKANNKLKGLNNQLVESNHIKEQYIGHFLNRCSNYIEKLENYQRFVNKKVAARKFTELFESTKSSQLIDAELAEFYETFDHSFLILFPNFVDQINELFPEDEKFVMKKGELLNTELRIFALIRLGIKDSSKIASLLRYSVNTIYNYRVKVKNKSLIDRDDFEDRVKKIGTLQQNF